MVDVTTSEHPIVTEFVDSLYSGDGGIPQLLQGKDYWVKIVKDEFNRRVSVVEYGGDLAAMTFTLFDWCRKNNLSKVILKAKEAEWEGLLSLGFSLEGINKYFYNGDYAYFMAKFLDPQRRYSESLEKEDDIIQAVACSEVSSESAQPNPYSLSVATSEDVWELAKLYDRVFDTYPTPLNDSDYLETLMETKAIFQVIRHEGRIVSAASALMDGENCNAEITDCATLPAYRGKGLMSHLLFALEEVLEEQAIRYLYGMARALSHGMNLLFKRHQYVFQGRLINHCNIMGKFEDVNLWVKKT